MTGGVGIRGGFDGSLKIGRQQPISFLQPIPFVSSSRDCITMSQKSIDVSFVPDADFYDCKKEVEALPLQKHMKWHRKVQDYNGVFHRVHFLKGELVFKDASQWATLKPLGDARLHDVDFVDPADEEKFQRWNEAHESGGALAAREEHTRLVEESATGNHHSKPHKIRVHTRPGEPVRG